MSLSETVSPVAGPVPDVLVGVDIGGTTTQVVLCTDDLVVLDRIEVPTPARQGGPAMMRAVIEAVAALRERVPSRLLAVGVGAAGVVDARTGRILVASDSFTAWAGTAVTATLTSALGVPAFLDNDVNTFLRGEVAKGAVEGASNAFGITLGTGVGGALWMNGALVDGPHGAAGEVGHIPGFGDILCTCGGRGHLETLASGRSIGHRYGEATGRQATAQEVAAAAAQGDPDALAVFDAAGAAIARAILITAGVVDVTTVVIGGGVSRAWGLLEPSILRALADEPPVSGHPVHLSRARLGSDAVALGAASLARTGLTARLTTAVGAA